MNFYSSTSSFNLLFGFVFVSLFLPLHGVDWQKEFPKAQSSTPVPVDPKTNSPINVGIGNNGQEIFNGDSQAPVPKLENTTDALIEQVIHSQLDDLRDLDFSKAYYANMSLDFQKAFNIDVFKAFVRKNPVLYRNKSFQIESTKFHGILAEVVGKIIATDSQEARVQYDLIQENGTWKIRSVNIKILTSPPAAQKLRVTRPQSR